MTQDSLLQAPIGRIRCLAQVREHIEDDALDGLARSVSEVGIQQPVLLRTDGDGYVLVDGERRLRVAKRLGLATIPALVLDRELAPAEIVQRQLIANCQRSDLTPLELARGIDQAMRAAGWSASEVAAKLGFSAATVTRSLALLSLPDAIQSQSMRAISASAGYELSRVTDPAEQARLATAAASGLSRDSLSGQLRRGGLATTPSTNGKPLRATVLLNGGRCVAVRGAAETLDGLIEVLEEALGKARRARTQGVTVATFCRLMKEQARA